MINTLFSKIYVFLYFCCELSEFLEISCEYHTVQLERNILSASDICCNDGLKILIETMTITC